MEEKASSKASMVSRLPKFGARPSAGSAAPLVNGCAQAPPSPEGKSNPPEGKNNPPEGKSKPPGKANGLIRAASFTLKWRKDNGSSEQSLTAGDKVEGRGLPQIAPLPRETKKPATPAPKARRFGATVTVSSPKAVPKQESKRSPSPKPAAKPSPCGRSSSPQGNGLRPTQNGAGRLGSALRLGRGSGLVRPRASSASPRSSSRDSLSQSSDSLKASAASSAPSSDSMVRSQSYTHIKQLPSPADAPIPRSFSFNRAVELAKPLANTQLRPPALRPPQASLLPSGRPSGLQPPGKVGAAHERSPASTPGGSTGVGPTPPSGLRKPLLPSSMLTKPSRLAYRPTRPAENKAHPQLPLVAGRTAGDGKGEEAVIDSEVSPLTSPELSADSEKVS